MTILPFLASLVVGSLALVGFAIGLFYRKKFGESTRGWFLVAGTGVGLAGIGCTGFGGALFLCLGNLIALAGAVLLAIGTFWLWFVMMGPRR